MGYAVVFPGQGSQFVGMADGWASDPAGKAVLDEASEAMGRDVVAGCHDEDALATILQLLDIRFERFQLRIEVLHLLVHGLHDCGGIGCLGYQIKTDHWYQGQ